MARPARNPLAVPEPKDRLASLALLPGVGLEVGVVEGAEDHVLDVANGNPARAIQVWWCVDREAVRAERSRIGLAALEAAIEAMHCDLATGDLRGAWLRRTRGCHLRRRVIGQNLRSRG